jgi:hypothetical protein
MPTRRNKNRRSGSDQEKSAAQATPQLTPPSGRSGGAPEPEDGHLGATEEQVSETPAPAGEAFEDEPKQG